MRHIQKSQEPPSLARWNARRGNKTSNWKSFDRSVKNDVYQYLLKEQGNTCAYCGIRISRRTCHIEHFRPKSKYPHLTFAYTNLIASCQGEDEQRPTRPVHCGHKKTNWFDEELMISPLDTNCGKYFRFSGSGDILPTDQTDQASLGETTIKHLALNIDKLRKMRRVAIDAAIYATEGIDTAEIELLAHSYQQLDEQGQYTPFAAAIVYILQQFFM